MFGRVTKFFHDRGYGFIHGEDGNTNFVHASKLYSEYLDKGYYVYFKTYKTEKSNYNTVKGNPAYQILSYLVCFFSIFENILTIR